MKCTLYDRSSGTPARAYSTSSSNSTPIFGTAATGRRSSPRAGIRVPIDDWTDIDRHRYAGDDEAHRRVRVHHAIFPDPDVLRRQACLAQAGTKTSPFALREPP